MKHLLFGFKLFGQLIFGLALLVGAVLLVVNSEQSFSLGHYPVFDLYRHGYVSSAIIKGVGGTRVLEGLSPEKSGRLEITVVREQIDVPWTAYLPFYQFGTVKASRELDVTLTDATSAGEGPTVQTTQQIVRGDTVAVENTIHRWGLIPISREAQARKLLNDALANAINARVREGNELNHRTNLGTGTVAL